MSVDAQISHPQAEAIMEEPTIPASLLDLLSSGTDSLDLESPSAKAYLDRLVSLGLDNLAQEPSIISNERSAVDLELVNLCYREYSTFTSVHQCSAAIGAAFDDFDNSLDKLIESIPALEDECRQFGKGTAELQSARKRAVLLQEHEDKLLDVLEIPQLMETCVRNGYYQEALELSSHVSSLRAKHHAIIVDDVADEANGILQLMTAQLLGILREPVKLPALIKAVGYLRKLQDLDDVQLGLAFLSSRLHNYRARLIEIEKDRAEPVRYLRRYIDLFREHVFDIISQYTTIFSGVTGDQLATFVNLCVDDLVQLVHRYIPRIASDSAAMSSILVQLGYCSLSFARAGLDFSSLLVEPFKSSIKLSYDQAAESAAAIIKTAMSLDPQPAPATSLVSANHLQQILTDLHSPPRHRKESDSHTPPAVLAQFPPIAQYLNAHLTALNSLRLLAPFQSLPALQASQNKSIQQATAAVLDYVEQAVATDMSAEFSRSSGSRHRHTRTNSTPRSHLIRRNTETQLSAETLAAKRRETKRICVAFADAWLTACEFLRRAMAIVLETEMIADNVDEEVLKQLEEWIEANREKDLDAEEQGQKHRVNGNQMNPLEEGSEAVDGLDTDQATESTSVPTLTSPPVASHEAAPAILPRTISEGPAQDETPPPVLPEPIAETPNEPSAEPTVEQVTFRFGDQPESDSPQGVDLPPVPVQVETETEALEPIEEPAPKSETTSTPPHVELPISITETSRPVEIEAAPVVEDTLPDDVAPVAVIADNAATPVPDIEPDLSAGKSIEPEAQLGVTTGIGTVALVDQADTNTSADSESSVAEARPISPFETAVTASAVQLDSNTDMPSTSVPIIDVPESVTPPEMTEVADTVTPTEEDDGGDEPGTGTVTPITESNGQEASAPKTNKKKKKKKGKK